MLFLYQDFLKRLIKITLTFSTMSKSSNYGSLLLSEQTQYKETGYFCIAVSKLQCTTEYSWLFAEKVVYGNYTGFKKEKEKEKNILKSKMSFSLLQEILIYYSRTQKLLFRYPNTPGDSEANVSRLL